MIPYHVIPVNDLIEHRTNGESCQCRPTTNDSLVRHNAIDNREFNEIAEEINNEAPTFLSR